MKKILVIFLEIMGGITIILGLFWSIMAISAHIGIRNLFPKDHPIQWTS